MAVVEVEEQGRILHVRLNRPEKRNTLTPEINRLLRDAFERFNDARELWVAVISGRGQDFCAGVDLSAPPPRGRDQTWPGGITREYECWKPIIAALHGNVLGGGLELALCADLRVGDTTTRLGAPEVKWGLMQGAGATQRLPRCMPFAVALELLFTGDPIEADRAERVGLLNHVVAAGEALDAAMALAERICRRAPLGVSRAKEAAYRGRSMTVEDGLHFENEQSRKVLASEDAREGPLAFAQKRKPAYKGK